MGCAGHRNQYQCHFRRRVDLYARPHVRPDDDGQGSHRRSTVLGAGQHRRHSTAARPEVVACTADPGSSAGRRTGAARRQGSVMHPAETRCRLRRARRDDREAWTAALSGDQALLHQCKDRPGEGRGISALRVPRFQRPVEQDHQLRGSGVGPHARLSGDPDDRPHRPPARCDDRHRRRHCRTDLGVSRPSAGRGRSFLRPRGGGGDHIECGLQPTTHCAGPFRRLGFGCHHRRSAEPRSQCARVRADVARRRCADTCRARYRPAFFVPGSVRPSWG